jgi:hypothetical protein
MKTKILFALSFAALLFGCGPDREELAQRHTLDSLRSELSVNNEVTATLMEVSALMDSIERGRKIVQTDLEGSNHSDYVSRMKTIRAHIEKTHDKLEGLDKTLQRSQSATASYSKTIKALKENLDALDQEIATLSEQVLHYKNQNDNLATTVELQRADIEDKLSQIEIRSDQALVLEEHVSALWLQSKVREGEAYFARAAAVEEMANRTRFAPRKKKETIREAIELYKLAQIFGKVEAEQKVIELQKRLG